MKISLITVAYKNSKVVIDLLNSIAKYNDIGDELEVIVVDNSPEAARIEEAIKVADYKDYIYIKADNKGFGAGNNRGAEIAKGEILAFLNPDIILIEPIFRKICNKFVEDEKLAWLGGQLLTIDGKKNNSYSYRFEYSASLINNLLSPICQKLGWFDAKKMYMLGANIIIRKDLFVKIGKFDEQIFMYGEENDLAGRIEKILPEYKLKFCADIKIIHLEKQSTNFIDKERFLKQIQSSIYVAKKLDVDYAKIWKINYSRAKWKNLIDRFLRPKIYDQRKGMMQVLEEQFPELIN